MSRSPLSKILFLPFFFAEIFDVLSWTVWQPSFFVVVVVHGERFDRVKLYGGCVLSDEEDFAQIFRGERFF